MNKKKIIIFIFVLFAFFTFVYYNKYVNKDFTQLSPIEREKMKSQDKYLDKSFITTKYSTGGNVLIKTK